jgi:hypothetical protein
MTNGEFEKVYKDKKLTEYICAQARRHFKYADDIEDAKQEAWISVSMTNVSCTPGVYENAAYRAIHAYYERCLWRSKKEIPDSLCGGIIDR